MTLLLLGFADFQQLVGVVVPCSHPCNSSGYQLQEWKCASASRHLLTELSANKPFIRQNADPAQIKPVRVPASSDSRVTAPLFVRVLSTGAIQQGKRFVCNIEHGTSQTGCQLSTAHPMPVIRHFIDATGVMEQGKQAYHRDVCPCSRGQ